MSRIHPALFWIGVSAIVLVALLIFSPILLPFVVGMLLAYLLNPPVTRLCRMGVGRSWASLLVLLLSLVLFIGVLLLLFPMLQQQVVELISRLPDLIANIRERLQGLLTFAQTRVSPETADKIQQSVGGMAGDLAGDAAKILAGLLGGIWAGSFALVNILSLIFITPLVSFYLLNDWEKIVTTIDNNIPLRHRATVREIARDIDAHLAGYVRGMSLNCVILAVFYGTALTLVGLDFGLVVGLLSGLISFVPFVGALFGFIVSVGLALIQYSDLSPVALVAGIFILGQIIEGNVLQPWLVGRQVNMHPVWIIFSLFAGGSVFGFLGVLLGVPIAVVISVVLRFAIKRYREGPHYNEPAPALPAARADTAAGRSGQGPRPAPGGPDSASH